MKTAIIKIADEKDAASIQRAARLLEQGALVAFPTETVYGIGCRVEPEAIERLNHLKDRLPEKHYTLHLGSVDQISTYVPIMSLRAQKLVRNALPGPVTIVFELDAPLVEKIRTIINEDTFCILYRDNTIGIRCPDHPIASAILSTAQCAVVAPSANPAGQSPAVTFEQARHYYDGVLDAIVACPVPMTYQKSSTVVKIGKTYVQVLREGAVPSERIRQLTTIRILFVCTGNTCRSPMAEAICRTLFCNILGCSVDELADFGYIVRSAGVAAIAGMPASDHAIEICRWQDISLQEHRSLPLTPQRIDESDRIFVMSRSHRESILEFYPEAAEKSFLLDEDGDIADPIGQGIKAYQQCYKQIEKAIRQRISEIL